MNNRIALISLFLLNVFCFFSQAWASSGSPPKIKKDQDICSARRATDFRLPPEMLYNVMFFCNPETLIRVGNCNKTSQAFSEELFKKRTKELQSGAFLELKSSTPYRQSFLARYLIRKLAILVHQDPNESSRQVELRRMLEFFKNYDDHLHQLLRILSAEKDQNNKRKSYPEALKNFHACQASLPLEARFVLVLSEKGLFDEVTYSSVGPQRSYGWASLLAPFIEKTATLRERLLDITLVLRDSKASYGIWNYYISAFDLEKSLKIHEELAKYFYQNKNFLEAESQLAIRLEKKTENPGAIYADHAWCLMELNRLDEADRQFKKFLKTQEASGTVNLSVLISYGMCLMQKKEFSQSAGVFRAVLQKDSQVNFKVNLYYGSCLMHLDRFAAAAYQFSEVLRKNPEASATVNEHYGKCLLGYGKYPEALQQFEEALKKNPRELSENIYEFYGICLTKCKNFEKAREMFKKGLEKNPSRAQYIHKRIAALCLKKNE